MNQRGFTLIELMITIVIAGILLAVAAPSFQSVIRNNAMGSARDDLFNALQFARAEAVTSNKTISFCVATADLSGCDAANRDFANGWLLFEGDTAANAAIAANVLKVHPAYDNISMELDANSDQLISYLPSGLLATNIDEGVISVCDAIVGGAGTPRSIRITANTGQIRTGAESDAGC